MLIKIISKPVLFLATWTFDANDTNEEPERSKTRMFLVIPVDA